MCHTGHVRLRAFSSRSAGTSSFLHSPASLNDTAAALLCAASDAGRRPRLAVLRTPEAAAAPKEKPAAVPAAAESRPIRSEEERERPIIEGCTTPAKLRPPRVKINNRQGAPGPPQAAWRGAVEDPSEGPLSAGEAVLEARTQASVALFKLGAHSATLRPEFGGP